MNTILITSPSINTDENVSGISSLVATILERTTQSVDHFVLGSKDGERKNLKWAFKQVSQYFRFLRVLKTRDYNIIHINTSLVPLSIYRDVLFSFAAKRMFGKKVILHLHGGKFLMAPPKKGSFKKIIQNFLRHADKIIVLSELEREALEKFYGVSDALIFPNAVDTSFVKKFPERKYEYKEPLKVIFLGRINKSKGIHTITESLPFLKNYFDRFSLDIYGAGPELKDWLSDLDQVAGLNFNYNGVARGMEKWEALRRADIFILPSLYGEGLPIAMLEAMAAGCVVVVTDDASITSVIEDGKNGIIIPKNNPEILAGKIIGILEHKTEIEHLSNNSIQDIENNLSFVTYICKLEKLYLSLV